MIYTEKIQLLLESLDGKLRILQSAINGERNISPSDARKTLDEARYTVERITELNRINR
jgi:hypothetical protein